MESAPHPLLPLPRAALSARVAIYRAVERLAGLRQRLRARTTPPRSDDAPPPSHQRGSLWIFASTIGELTLIEPVLRRLLAELPGLPITLVTDRQIYIDTYRAYYPDAYVYCQAGDSADILRLAALTPPLGGLVVEIPCLPSDAPCRLPFTVPYELRRRGVPIALLNGWLYGYAPASGLDRLERRWFCRDYVRSFDLITAQNEEVRTRLLEAGAEAARVHVTGNTKFDAVHPDRARPPGERQSAKLLDALRTGGRKIIVAGCVTDPRDQERLLDAFERILPGHPDALLVLAPRHPENRERMARLRDSLAQRGHPALERTTHGDAPVPPEVRCLVLDTFGELRDFYEVATLTFVGRNHNLLEPLAFGKPVTTAGHWDTTFPSYPVYRALQAADLFREAQDAPELAEAWLTALAARNERSRNTDDRLARLAALRGATDRNLELLQRVFIPRLLPLPARG